MLKNIEIKEIPPTIVYEYPKSYTYSELPKNIEYLYKIADKTSNGVIICLCDTTEADGTSWTSCDRVKLCYPISMKLYAKFKRDDLITLNRSECLHADFNPDCFADLPVAIERLYEIIKDNGYSAVLPYRLVYINQASDLFSQEQKFTMRIQIPIEKSSLF